VPGDVVVLANPNGGDAPANWAAVINYFNPSDPTGMEGLVATEDRAFFPGTGPSGFAGPSFQLFPNTVYTPETANVEGNVYTGFLELGGAYNSSLPNGTLDFFFLTAIPAGSVPDEPGTIGLLGLGVVVLVVFARPGVLSRCQS